MEKKEKKQGICMTERLFGALPMGWPTVLAFAAAAAALTAVFLICPVFKGSSFERMGVTFEAWIFFAVIIMANCNKPLEAACRTFVFFLVSQPLIYLLQVPFSALGWQLFGYYRYWFLWTLLTFPMAYIGWYIKKKNWLSVLILAPVLAFLGFTAFDSARQCLRSFPHLLITALFCLLQILLYVAAFFPDRRQKLVGLLVSAAAAAVFFFVTPQVDLTVIEPLPGEPVFSETASIAAEDSSIVNAQFHDPEAGVVYLHAQKYGSTTLVIRDEGTESRYTLEVCRDEKGQDRIRITPQE